MAFIDGIIVDIFNRTSFPGTVHFNAGRITKVCKASGEELFSDRFSKTLPFIMPGFVDSHIHLDMTQLSPCEYAKLALSQGVIGAVADCHDISAVLGKQGVLDLVKNAKASPFYFNFSAPANVIEGIYDYSDIEELLSMKEFSHLGEIKDFPSVILHEPKVERVFELTKKYKKFADGCAPGVSGDNLREYALSVIATDHSVRSYEDGVEKIKAGLDIQLKFKETLDFLSIKDLIENFPKKTMLCSDVIFGPNINKYGYINTAVKELLDVDCNFFDVLTTACINPVKFYSMGIGLLKEGDSADFILVDNETNFKVLKTFIKGECVWSVQDFVGDKNEFSCKSPESQLLKPRSNSKAKKISEKDLEVVCKKDEAKLNVIDAFDDEINTVRKSFLIKPKGNKIQSNVEKDVLKVVLVNRLGKESPSVGFVHGFGIKKGAFAISIGHEEHNFSCVGVDDKDMVVAMNRLIDLKGGLVYAVDSKVICELPLEYGGLISIKTAMEVEKAHQKTHEAMRNILGCTIRHPIYTLSYLCNTAIPTLKLSSKGLYSVPEEEVIALY